MARDSSSELTEGGKHYVDFAERRPARLFQETANQAIVRDEPAGTVVCCRTLRFLFFSSRETQARKPEPGTLPDYVPLLPQVQAKAIAIDPKKGYAVKELKPGIFMITDGAYESVFATTGNGVVLFDAPPSFAQHIVSAVSETTKEPIVELVYTHIHVDHIGGASLILQENPSLEILAEAGTAEFLREMHDPHRPVPTRTFKDHYTLKRGSLTAEMKVGYWHTPEGDLLIAIPDKKFVIAIDAFSAGATPFMGFDLTMNMHDYLKVLDTLLAMDFDVMVPGHHSAPATREDVQIAKDYVTDVYNDGVAHPWRKSSGVVGRGGTKVWR